MRRLLPDPGEALSDDDLLREALSPTPGRAFVRFNMVSSLDGRAAVDGVSSGLGTEADRRLFPLLGAVADAIVVGSGTAVAEGYAGELLPESLRAWRLAHGLSERPTTVVLSATASIDADAPVLVEAPAPTLVLVSDGADPARVAALRARHDVVPVPDGAAPAAITRTLTARGLTHLHHEGGPGILARYVAADALDALCLTLSPLLAPSGHGAITAPFDAAPVPLAVHRLYEDDSTLLAEYRRGARA